MTPPAAAGWNAERAAKELFREHYGEEPTLPIDIEIVTIFARHLTLARSTAPSAEAMRWQLIETATKDETRRLLWAPSMPAPHIGYWDRGWRNNHYGEREGFWYFAEVTHWMPLPAAPAILPPAQPPAVALSSIPAAEIDIVFDGPPGPEAGRFVEVESPPGKGIRFGEWVLRPDGYWVLRIQPSAPTLPAVRRAVLAALGAGLCPEDAVVLGAWVKRNGGAGE